MCFVLVTSLASFYLRDIASQLAHQTGPALEVINQVDTGLKTSDAAIRSWVTINNSFFLEQRNQAWNNDAYPGLVRLKSLISNSPEKDQLTTLLSLEQLSKELDNWQRQIVDVAHTPGNKPASNNFNQFAQPLIYNMKEITQALIDNSKDNNIPINTLITLVNIQGHLFQSERALENFTHSASTTEFNTFTAHQKLIKKQLSNISKNGNFDSIQLQEIEILNNKLIELQSIAETIYDIRNSDQWNIAQTILRDNTTPIAQKLEKLTDKLSRSLRTQNEKNASTIKSISDLLPFIVFGSLFALFTFALIQSKQSANKISAPILSLVDATEAMAEGRLAEIDILSTDEIGRLEHAFNHMISTRRRNDAQLEVIALDAQIALEALENYKFALDQHAIVETTDLKGNITFANNRFIEISGYSAEELLGQNHRMLKSGKHDIEFFRTMYDTIANGEVWHGDVCNKSKNGDHYWVNSTIIPFMKDGKPDSYISIRSDITERRLLEIELQKVALLALENPGMVFKVSNEFRILFANPAAKLYLESININEGELVPRDWEQCIKEVFANKAIDQFNITQNEALDAPTITTQLTLKYITTTTVNIYGSNITKLKEIEADLIKSKKVAENAAIAKSDFLASMSHEIRTPMNGVLGMLGLLLKTQLTEDQKRKAVVAKTSADSLLSLINDILDFSKVEAGKLELEILDFNLRAYLGDLAEAMALKAQEKHVELVLDVTEVDHSMVRGDPGRVRQIFTNLIGNAIKFTDAGEIVIKAGLKKAGDTGLLLYCSVTDTGVGIPQDKLTTLFDTFSQVDASTTRKYGGTGLGLAIVKQLCELMGGSVGISSELGKGSKFEFSIVLQRSEQSQSVMPTVDIHNVPLLIVDDNATNRDVLRSQLEHWGADVTEANTATTALQILANRCQHLDSGKPPFAVAFLDMKMPDIDGKTLGKIIRENSKYDQLHLILMTSMASEGTAKDYAELGFSGFFPKPTTTRDLFGALAVMLDNRNAPDKNKPLVTHEYLETLEHEDNSIKGVRVLLVEDNQINQEIALCLLSDFGIIADIANDGLEALAALQRHQTKTPYQLIFMDCQMPNMDGYEATKCIRNGKAGELFKDIPIIAMTANAMVGDKEECIAAGMSDYLSKPIDEDELQNCIRRWLTEEEDSEEVKKENYITIHDELLALDIWDKNVVLDRVKGQPVVALRLLQQYISTEPLKLENLKLAVKNKEYIPAGKIARGIQGSSTNLGAVRVLHIAHRMDTAGKDDNGERLKALLPLLIDHFEDFIELIRAVELDDLNKEITSTSIEQLSTVSKDNVINNQIRPDNII